MIRRFLEDTRDMILDGLAAVGLLRGGSVWWKARVQRRMDAAREDAENLRRAVASTQRMCRECRALVPNRERHCTECGAPMQGIPRGGASRIATLLLPSFGSASVSLLSAIVVVYLAVAFAAPAGPAFMRPPGTLLHELGAKWYPAILAGEWWRLVNPIFLHGSLLHLFFNGYALANLGPSIEGSIGGRRFLVVFVATGIIGFVVSCLASPFGRSVGASGALYGLIGFGIVHGRRLGGTLGKAISDDLARWAIFGLLLSLAPGIDLAAHLGGFLCGAALGMGVGLRAPRAAWVERAWSAGAALAVLLPILGFALALLRR